MHEAKDRITLYMSAKLIRSLKELAHARGVSLNELGGELLTRSLEREVEGAGMSILLPELELMFKTELARAVERMIRLHVRGTLESMTNRRILTNFMHKSGIDRKIVTEVNEAAYQSAVRSLKAPLEDLQEIIEAANGPSRL